MSTRKLGWIWEDDEDLLEPDPLGELVERQAGNGAGSERPHPEPAIPFLDDDDEDDEPPSPRRRRGIRRRRRAAADAGDAPPPSEPAPPDDDEPEPRRKRSDPDEARPGRVPARRRQIGAWSRGARFWGVVVLALVVGTVAPQLIELSTDGGGGGSAPSPPPAQQVVVWNVGTPDGDALLAVLATGARPPVAVAIPDQVTINLPGQSLGTLRQAAAGGDDGLVEVSVENLLGVAVDRMVSSDIAALSAAVDAAGGIEVLDGRLAGPETTAYLAQPPEDAPVDAVFLRWQDVLDGLLSRAAESPAVAASLPPPLDSMLRGRAFDFTALPVIDIGGGLLRPQPEEIEELVDEHFLRPPSRGIRIAVLNGVGTPGIGEDVATVLVPEGFRLVSSGNATSFDFKETLIIAGSREHIADAQRARTLLGVGKVLLSDPPSGFTDVTVVVGRDFGGS